MTNNELFINATRANYQFPFRGMINVIDLWDLSLANLDSVFKTLNAEAKKSEEEGLLNTKSKEDEEISNKIEIVKYIVSVKLDEKKKREDAKKNAEMRQRLLEIKAKRQDAKLENMSDEDLDKALAELGESIDYAIDVDVPDENIVKRMSGRRACVSCGATYHVVHVPPKKEGICDRCGSELILRDDDKPETVKNRLDVYHKQTQPLIDFYTKKGVLKTVDGTVDMQDVFKAIVAILGE